MFLASAAAAVLAGERSRQGVFTTVVLGRFEPVGPGDLTLLARARHLTRFLPGGHAESSTCATVLDLHYPAVMALPAGASTLMRSTRRLDASSLSRSVFPIFVVGLASSITLSESALAVLTASALSESVIDDARPTTKIGKTLRLSEDASRRRVDRISVEAPAGSAITAG